MNTLGGLIGTINGGMLLHAYSSGQVSGTGHSHGGLVGSFYPGSVDGAYWNMDTSGKTTSAAGSGRSGAAMMSRANFIGWDISAEGGESTVWRIFEGSAMPLLRGFLAHVVTATANDAVSSGVRVYSGGNGIRYSPRAAASCVWDGAL